jgi:ABC-type nitrate/sulfonate/bicarbonate transport system permease component
MASVLASAEISAAPAAEEQRAKRRARFAKLVAGLVILCLWEGVVRALAPAYVAKPSTVLLAIPSVLASAAFLKSTGITLAAAAEGLVIATILGVLAGLAMGRSLLVEAMARHYVNGFYAIPMIVILPLVTLWFGYTSAARLATIVFAAFFSIALSTADGARAVPREHLEVARSFRSPRGRDLVEIVLPSALPYLLAGIRLAAGRTLIGAVVAEFFTAIDGLGYFILFNSRTFHHDRAFVAVLLLAGFGVGIDGLVNFATRRFLPWYRQGTS